MRMTKDPQAVLDYGFDWSAWLADGETITASSWLISDTGLTADSDEATDTTATIWLSGGTLGTTYRVTNHIITSQNRQDDRTLTISVVNL